MRFISFYPIFVGFETTEKGWRVCALKKKRGSFEPLFLEEVNQVRVLQDYTKRGNLATSLAQRETLFRSMTIPLVKEREIRMAFEFHVEPHLPYPLEKCIVDYLVTSKSEEGSYLSLFSVKKEHLERHLLSYKELGIDPEVTLSPAIALAALVGEGKWGEGISLFVHVANQEGVAALIEKGSLVQVRSFEEADFDKVILSLLGSLKNKKVEKAYLLALEERWKERLQNVCNLEPTAPHFPTLKCTEKAMERYALPIGLALAASKRHFPNFRKKEFKAPFPWKKLRGSFTLFTLSVLLFNGILFWSLSSQIKKREKRLFEKSSSLVKKEITSWEEAEKELLAFEKKLSLKAELFPLMPNSSSLSSLVKLLSQVPHLQVEKLSYRCVKYPTLTHPLERYQILVELKCLFKEGSSDALRAELTNSPCIDASKGIEWSDLGNGHMRALFYLKDRTRYPS